MEQVTETIGNPTALLVERLFWLGLGAFLGLAILNSLIRELKDRTNPKASASYDQLEKLADKAIKKNRDMD